MPAAVALLQVAASPLPLFPLKLGACAASLRIGANSQHGWTISHSHARLLD